MSKAGRLLAQLLRNASGFNPPSRLFNSPPASESVFTVPAACVMLPALKPCLNIEGLMKLVNEDTLFAMLMASETLPAALSQFVLPPPAQLLKKEVGFSAPANCVNRLLGLDDPPALERTSFNCARDVVAVRPITNNSSRSFFGRKVMLVMVFFLNITPFLHIKSGRRRQDLVNSPGKCFPASSGSPGPGPLIRPHSRPPETGLLQIQLEFLASQQLFRIHFIMTHFRQFLSLHIHQLYQQLTIAG